MVITNIVEEVTPEVKQEIIDNLHRRIRLIEEMSGHNKDNIPRHRRCIKLSEDAEE